MTAASTGSRKRSVCSEQKHRMGAKLYASFVAAGLPGPEMRESTIIGGSGASPWFYQIAEFVRTMPPEMARVGVMTAAEVDVETLVERLQREVAAGGGIITGRSEVGLGHESSLARLFNIDAATANWRAHASIDPLSAKTRRISSTSDGPSASYHTSSGLPLLFRVLGRLPLKDDATHSGGRRPRSLRGGNRGPGSLDGAAHYGECGVGRSVVVCTDDRDWRA